MADMTPAEYQAALSALRAKGVAVQEASPAASNTKTLPSSGDIGSAIMQIPTALPSGIASGLIRAGSGAAQGLLDLGTAMGIVPPGTTEKATGFADQMIDFNRRAFGTTPAGEFIGQIAPSLMVGPEEVGQGLLGQAMKGAISGGVGAATGRQDAPDVGTRLSDRALETGIAAGGGLALGMLGGQATKMAGASDITKGIKSLEQTAATDPLLAPARKAIVKQVDKLRGEYTKRATALLGEGDKFGAVLDTQDVSNLSDFLSKARVTDPQVKAILQGVESSLLPPIKLGNVVLGSATSQIGNRYSALKKASESLNGLLEQDLSKGDAAAVQFFQHNIDTALGKFEANNPSLGKRVKALTNYYDNGLGKLSKTAVQDVLNAPDDQKMAATALATVIKGKPEDAKLLLDVFGEPLKRHVENAAITTALDQAEKATGAIDPVRFTKFFDDNPRVKAFLGDTSKDTIDGVKNLISDINLRRGSVPQSTATSVMENPWTARAGLIGTGLLAGRGNYPEAIAGMVSTFGMRPLGLAIRNALDSDYGRALAAAAANAKPGSPRIGRIMNVLLTKFGPGATGNELVDMFNQRGPFGAANGSSPQQ